MHLKKTFRAIIIFKLKLLAACCIIILSLSLSVFNCFAQSNYTISGAVSDENKKPIADAIIFVDGSEIVTTTDNFGRYKLNVPGLGSYTISVKMMGYDGLTKDVMLKTRAMTLDLSLTLHSVLLDEVKIGVDKKWQSDYELFKTQFLGSTPNAKACEIVNPEVLSFKMDKSLFTARANDILVIVNPHLGYRIKYMLKYFRFSQKIIGTMLHVETSYDGNTVFEELQGTNDQKQEWVKNRALAYRGSMVHFMRSVFSRRLLEEGFIVTQLSGDGNAYDDNKPVNFDTLETSRNQAFVTFRSTGLHITYNVEASLKLAEQKGNAISRKDKITNDVVLKYHSYLLPGEKQIVVDARGRTSVGYIQAFDIKGDWSNQRLADQVPFEYSPPVSNIK
ncbi:carboxypeptidase-like regulatory domain-containing protein [Mucilaginibacter corticis]|uniref:Carboxypeptidase-like regulatory domain-containing protein n=1 Tax=Mucilaginibacter corticis TaxID=2597670 RepID=A0A556MX78_9SPHI|nr:carboxypeptidase-like regulatory domain-containing protein [Mucilaginibacter corticis]